MTGIIINKLTFGYTSPLIEDLICTFSEGWTAVVGENGCGKTTLIRLIMGTLKPWSGTVTLQGNFAYCSQNPENPPSNAENFMLDYSGDTMRCKGILGIEDDWTERWNTLSFGERIRFQTACALSLEPDILLADEPTNHLDRESREMVYNSLKMFRGTGILVSHDRMLLNTLPRQCLFIDPPSAVLRPGNYEAGKAEELREFNEAVRNKTLLQKRVGKLKVEAARKRHLAARGDSDRSKKNLGHKDHDGRAKLDLARLTGRDAVQGKLYTKLQNRILREEEKISEINIKKQRELRLYSEASVLRSDFIFRIESGMLEMGVKDLAFPELVVSPEDRIGIVGPNGCGKSSLIKHITTSFLTENYLYIPQEIPEKTEADFLRKVKNMPREEKAKIYASIDRLGSDPKRLIETEIPSPGELRKLILAEGFLHSPSILIMDEPTNHMDLDSVECLESALQETDCTILLVSHDKYFMENVVDKIWMIKVDKSGFSCRLILK